MTKQILAIDPGLDGAFVFLNGKDFKFHKMPVIKNGKDREIDFEEVLKIIKNYNAAHVFLERAMPMAMGSKHAFNYGRGFATLEIALRLASNPLTYVEPSRWARVMHEGISADLKAKAKSCIALDRLGKNYKKEIPVSKTGKMHEGVVDALLIALYGLRVLSGKGL